MAWYLRSPMGLGSVSSLVKNIFQENGLDPHDYTNKSGRTTLVTRMGEAGVPLEVGVLVTGHSSEKSYGRYDRSKEVKVGAATDASLTYVKALEQETTKLKASMVDGVAEESPPKRMKGVEDQDVSSARDSIAVQLTNLEIDSTPVPMQSEVSGPSGLTLKNLEGKRVRKLEDVQDPSDWDWMMEFDWESDLKLWDEGRAVAINPISGLIGKLVNCDGLTINFHGNVNFRS